MGKGRRWNEHALLQQIRRCSDNTREKIEKWRHCYSSDDDTTTCCINMHEYLPIKYVPDNNIVHDHQITTWEYWMYCVHKGNDVALDGARKQWRRWDSVLLCIHGKGHPVPTYALPLAIFVCMSLQWWSSWCAYDKVDVRLRIKILHQRCCTNLTFLVWWRPYQQK